LFKPKLSKREYIYIYIINDGSTDNTKQIIENINFKNLILVNRENKGVLTSWIELVNMCKQEWFAFLEADDTYEPDFLKEMVRLHNLYPKKPMIDGMSINTIDGNGKILQKNVVYHNGGKKYNRMCPEWNRLINKKMVLEAFKDYNEENYLNNFNDGIIMAKIHQYLNKKMPLTKKTTMNYRVWPSTSHIAYWKEKHFLEWIKYYTLLSKYITNKRLNYEYNFMGGVFEDKIYKLLISYISGNIDYEEYKKIKELLLPIFTKHPKYFNKKTYNKYLFNKIKDNSKLLGLATEFYGFIPKNSVCISNCEGLGGK